VAGRLDFDRVEDFEHHREDLLGEGGSRGRICPPLMRARGQWVPRQVISGAPIQGGFGLRLLRYCAIMTIDQSQPERGGRDMELVVVDTVEVVPT
jgi:hypothetical protein